MDKKVLVSLMMTAPVASMFAANWETNGNGVLDYAINPAVNAENWKANGAGQFDDKSVPGSIVCPVSAGYLTHNQTLAVGKYSIAYGTMDNAILKINNVWQAKKVNGKYVGVDGKALKDQTDYTKMVPEFPSSIDLSKSGALTVLAYPVDNSKNFTVGKITLTLQGVNFATIKKDLQNRLDAIVAVKINAEDKRDEAKPLRTEYNTIENVKRTAIQDDIDTIDLDDAQALFSAYSTLSLNLWNVTASQAKDVVSEAIKSFNTTVANYNTKANAENLAWDNTVKNTDALNALNQEVINLRAQLNTKQTEIDNILLNNPQSGQIGEYCKFITAEDIAAAKAAIDKYQADINAAYADLAKTVNFPSRNTAISNQIAAISYDTAIADWKAYSKFLSDVLPQVNDFYGKIFALVNDTKIALNPEYNHAPVANVYDDTIYQVNLELAKYFKQNKEYVINQEGGLTPDNKNIAGAAKAYDDVVADANERMKNMQAKYDETLNPDTDSMLVKQEAQWKDAKKIIADYHTELDAKQEVAKSDAFKELKPADQTKINNDIKDIQNALTALENEAVTEYLAHNLKVDGADFTSKTGKVDEANTKYDNDAKALGGVLGLIADFNAAKAYVKSATSVDKLKEYNLYDVFNTAFNNIDAAIKTFYNDKKGTEADITKSIEDVQTMCDDLVSAYNTVLDQVAQANTALASFKTAIDKKQVVKLGDDVAYVKSSFVYETTLNGKKVFFGYTDFENALTAYKTQLKDIAANSGNPMEAYDAAIAESNVITSDDYKTKIGNAQQAFIEEVSEANLKFVQDIADDITVKTTEAPYADAVGMAPLKNKELELPKDYDGADSVEKAANNVAAANGNAAKLATCDSDLQVLAEAYNKIYSEIQKVVANYDAKVALDRVANTVQNAINTFISDINKVTVAPASIHYQNVANGVDNNNSFQSRLNSIETEILNAYNGSTAANQTVKTTLNKKLTELKNDIVDEKAAMEANQQSYDNQVNRADELATNANTLIDFITNNDKVASNRDAYLKQVNDILNELAELNVSLTKDFGEGKSTDNDPTYQERFQQIQEQLNAIELAEDTNYLNAVKNSNTDWFKNKYLGSNVLTNEYNAAVEEVNDFRYNLTNADYYNQLISNPIFQENHEDLQACYSAINALNAQFQKYENALYPVGSTRDNWTVLGVDATPAILDGVKFADIEKEAKRLHVQIETCLNNILNVSQTVANEFYEFNEGVANELWNSQLRGSIVNRLIAAGLTQNTIDPETGKTIYGEINAQVGDELADLASARKSYKDLQAAIAANKDKAVHNYIMGMDGIANLLAKILPVYADRSTQNGKLAYADKVVKEAVNSQWTANYNAALTTLNGYLTDMALYTDDPNLTDNKKAINNAKNAVNNLNTKWNRLKNDAATRESNFNKFDNIDLKEILDNAKTVYEASKEAHLTNEANKALKESLLEGDNSELKKTQNALDELLIWSGYRDAQVKDIQALQNKINAAEATVNAAVSSQTVKADEASLKREFTNVQSDIAKAYPTVYKQEVEYANSLLMLAKSAFNDAKIKADKEGMEGAPDLDALDKSIRDYQTQLLNLGKKSVYENKTKAQLDPKMKEVFGVEDALCGIIEELEAYSKPGTEFGKPTLEETLAALDNKYDELLNEFNTLKSNIETQGTAADSKYGTYGTTVSKTYAPKVQTAIDTLEGYNSDYNKDKENVIASADKYEYLMDQLQKEVAGIEDEWKPAQAEAKKKADSDNKYDDFKRQLTSLQNDTEDAYNEADEVKANTYPVDYNSIMVNFLGVPEDVETGTPAIPSQYEILDGLKTNFNVTALTYHLPYGLEDNVNSYVVNVLEGAAETFKNTTSKYGEALINGGLVDNEEILGIKNPGKNDNNWKLYVNNLDEYEADIFAQLNDLDEIETEPVKGYWVDVDTSDPMFEQNTNDVAEAKYLEVKAAIQTIKDKMKSLYDKATTEDLYVKGDVATDGEINILDVTALISLIGDQTKVEALEGVDKATADVNSDDEVNVADVTELVRYMMNPEYGNSGILRVRSFLPTMAGNNAIRVEEVTGENGMRRFAVLLTNEVNFAAGQLDIVLPSHAHVAGVSLGERANQLDSYVFENDGFTRVIMTSLENDMIEGNNGCVLFIDVEGDAEVTVNNAIFSDANGRAYKVGNNVGTGVDFINGVKDGVKAIYNAAGQKLNKLTKGVNIIRNADGTTTKKMGK